MNSKLSIILLGILYCTQAWGQNKVTYGYDLSGNRISRVIQLSPQRSAEAPDAEESEAASTEEPVEQEIHSEMLKGFSVLIYPNPTKGELTVKLQGLPEEKTAILMLYSASGSLVLQRTRVRDMEHLDISNQPAGIYVLKIMSEDSSTDWKIIKR